MSPKTPSLPRIAGAGIKYCCICLGGQGRLYQKCLAVWLQETEIQCTSCTEARTRAQHLKVKAALRPGTVCDCPDGGWQGRAVSGVHC